MLWLGWRANICLKSKEGFLYVLVRKIDNIWIEKLYKGKKGNIWIEKWYMEKRNGLINWYISWRIGMEREVMYIVQGITLYKAK